MPFKFSEVLKMERLESLDHPKEGNPYMLEFLSRWFAIEYGMTRIHTPKQKQIHQFLLNSHHIGKEYKLFSAECQMCLSKKQ